MTIQEVIKKAIEEGWKIPKRWGAFRIEWLSDNRDFYGYLFLDREFWMALGKAMGWDKPEHYGEAQFSGAWEMNEEKARNRYKEYWHRFIDHLAEGKAAEEFFELL